MLKKRYLFFGAVIVIAAVSVVLFSIFVSYSDYTIERNIRVENAGKTFYVNAFSFLLSYSPDGVALIDFDGSQKWNISFEMQNPTVETKGSYALVYDKQGSIIELLNRQGEVARINTSYPIGSASLSENGNIAVIMQQRDVAYVVTYSATGDIVARGELHAGELGYPMAASLSSKGDVLALSLLHLSEGDIKTQIVFYDFSADGEIRETKKLASFSYVNEVIPILDHMEGDRVLAIGGNSAVVFSSGTEPKVTHEVLFHSEIKSAVYNSQYFGIIKEEESEDGELQNVMDLYTLGGHKRFTKVIDSSYSECRLLENNEILFSDGKNISLYTSLGVKRFSYSFVGDIQDLFPARGLRRYFMLQNGELSEIRLSKGKES